MHNVDINKVLIPVDFSDPSRQAFYSGLTFSRLFSADTYVLHVAEPLHTFDSSYEDIMKVSSEVERLEKGVQRRLDELFEEGGVQENDRRRVKVEIRGGKPWLEILRFAVEKDMDLIVMATHGHTGIKQMLIGSTAERVVRRAPCPVLCVKPDDFKPDLKILAGDFLPS